MQLTIQVKPNSKIDHIGFDENGQLKVKIRAQPVDGKANLYLIAFLATIFNVSKSQIILLKGSNNRYKKIEIVEKDEEIEKILQKIISNK